MLGITMLTKVEKAANVRLRRIVELEKKQQALMVVRSDNNAKMAAVVRELEVLKNGA